jgi:leucyl/phenylalanyl-tRNA--protein transferase
VPVRRFPDPRSATRDGLVAVGGDLHPDSLRLAYRSGIFPWPAPGLPLLWFSPPERGVLDFADLHVPRSLERAARRSRFRLTVDADFPAVIRGCADTPRPGQDGTWITGDIVEAYEHLHALGVAHSVEAWDDGRLVGGIYGVDVDGAFAAESMFYREPDASKLALLHLVAHLGARGLDWLDIQVMTPHMARFGARGVSRDRFLARLAATRALGLRLFDAAG